MSSPSLTSFTTTSPTVVTPSSSPTSAPTKANSPALAISLGVIGAFILIAIIVITIRIKSRPSGPNVEEEEEIETPPMTMSRQSKPLNVSHPATQITPFGSQNTPGSDMRIATRRPDGAWQFSESTLSPGTKPSDMGSVGSLSTSTLTLTYYPGTVTPKLSREKLANPESPGADGEGPPPPAYDEEAGAGYIDHIKPPTPPPPPPSS